MLESGKRHGIFIGFRDGANQNEIDDMIYGIDRSPIVSHTVINPVLADSEV